MWCRDEASTGQSQVDFFVKKVMADVNQLIEYLYEESADLRRHGLEAILQLLSYRCRGRPPVRIDSLNLILQRMLWDESTEVNENSVAVAGIILFLVSNHSQVDENMILPFRDAVMKVMTRNVSCVMGDRDERRNVWCRFHHLSLCALRQICGSRVHERVCVELGLMRVLVSVIESDAYEPLTSVALVIMARLATVQDNHRLFDRPVVSLLQGVLAFSSSRTVISQVLVVLYNLSFDWNLIRSLEFGVLVRHLSNPLTVRILINALSDTDGADWSEDLVEAVVRGVLHQALVVRNTDELHILLQAVVSRTGTLHATRNTSRTLHRIMRRAVLINRFELLRFALFFSPEWIHSENEDSDDEEFLSCRLVDRLQLLLTPDRSHSDVHMILKFILYHRLPIGEGAMAAVRTTLDAWLADENVDSAIRIADTNMLDKMITALTLSDSPGQDVWKSIMNNLPYIHNQVIKNWFVMNLVNVATPRQSLGQKWTTGLVSHCQYLTKEQSEFVHRMIDSN